MEQCWRRLASGRSGRTPNSQEGGQAHSVVLALEVGGRWPGETAQFLQGLARLAPSLCLGSFKSVWQPHGSNVGVASWRAAQRVRSRRPCWSADQPLAREARFLRRTRCSETQGLCERRRRFVVRFCWCLSLWTFAFSLSVSKKHFLVPHLDSRFCGLR